MPKTEQPDPSTVPELHEALDRFIQRIDGLGLTLETRVFETALGVDAEATGKPGYVHRDRYLALYSTDSVMQHQAHAINWLSIGPFDSWDAAFASIINLNVTALKIVRVPNLPVAYVPMPGGAKD